MRESQAALKARAEEAEQEKAGLAHRVEDLRGKATASEFENQQLRQEAHNLRKAYEVLFCSADGIQSSLGALGLSPPTAFQCRPP